MKISEVKKLSPFEIACYWIREREAIRLKKEAGKPKPWTDDEILSSFRFCCVHRMDDKVSRWLKTEWYDRYFNHPNMLAACVIARHFNKPEVLGCITGHVFGKKYRPDIALKVIQEMKKAGHKVFSAAYMIHADQSADKAEMVINRVVQPLVDNPPPIDPSSMQRSVEALLPCWNLGSFMSGQIVSDMRWAVEGSWADAKTWAPMGPGSKKGINLLAGRDIAYPLGQDQFLAELKEFVARARSVVGYKIANRLEMIDWQNCMCEFSKYMRTLDGSGRPKQTYPGKA